MSAIFRLLRAIGHAIIVTIAVLYFLIDVLFLSLVRRVRQQITAWPAIRWTRAWVETLAPYPSLLVLLIPWIILEPIKPLGFIIFHRHHRLAGTIIVIIGELLKLAIFDQLFEMTKPRLLTLRWFAYCYQTWRSTIDHLKALPIWRQMRDWAQVMRRQIWDFLRKRINLKD